ncbi:MAG: cytochrome C [Gemmataceae bacterium]
MNKFRSIVAFLALTAAVVGVSVGSSSAQDKKKDDKKKTPSIKAVMKAMNGEKGLVAKANKASAEEKWEDAVKYGKDAKEFGEALGKNKAKKGDAESWEKLTKEYAEVATAIAEGAEKKDADAVKKAAEKFKKACSTCHDAHK